MCFQILVLIVLQYFSLTRVVVSSEWFFYYLYDNYFCHCTLLFQIYRIAIAANHSKLFSRLENKAQRNVIANNL